MSGTALFIAVCSNRPRPSVQKGSKGSEWWRREVHHIAQDGKTLCGRNAADWLTMDITAHDAANSSACCVRCAKWFKLLEPAKTTGGAE